MGMQVKGGTKHRQMAGHMVHACRVFPFTTSASVLLVCYLLFPERRLQVKSGVKCRKKREEKAEHGLKDLLLCDIEGNMSVTSFALSQLRCQLLLLDLVLFIK